jgi:hypothetical protein|tara:strand:+ start:197 stop:1066 length:870 start_codon:yes stop_codon:yes gene_type:complete
MRIILICIIFFSNFLFSQTDSNLILVNKDHKLRNIIIFEASTYSLAIVGFNELWYKNYEKSRFHFINDNASWLQMDKMGHLATSYYSGVVGIKAYKWTGLNSNKAIWIGGLSGTFFNTTIEILDGFSANWGASVGDLVANSLGSMLAISQELYWKNQRIQIRYSYSRSDISNNNTDLFGDSFIQRSLKDYNGQTYWLSCNINSFLNTNYIPKWLNFAIGHSANGMMAASNQTNDNRVRQFLLSFDIDLSRIEFENKFINTLIHTFGFIKIPLPTLEFSNSNFKFHPIYF